jgi:hypothetical protein
LKFTFLKIITMAILLSSCAYDYQVGVADGMSADSYTTMKFNNTYKVSEIDGEKFSRKPSIWNEGSHSIKLPPGTHTFTLTYSNSVGGVAGSINEYTAESAQVTVNMEAGKEYQIVSDIGLRQDDKIVFNVVEVF